MSNTQALLQFLKSQRVLVIASSDKNEPWITNVYFGVDEDFRLYFVSPQDNTHSKQFLINPQVAFSTVWFSPDDYADRKGVQGRGIVREAQNEEEIVMGVRLHNLNFPQFAQMITVDWIHTNEYGSKIWVIEPSYIKFWNDELYGEQETEEFTL